MGRSQFILNTTDSAVMRTQFTRFLSDFKRSGLAVEGPFSDHNGEVSRIARQISRRMEFCRIKNVAEVTMATLAPQNMNTGKTRSWLKFPFIFDELGLSGHMINSAADVAACKPVEYKSALAIPSSMEDLTLLTVAVLRKLGVKTHYAYIHYDDGFHPATLAKIIETFSGVPYEIPQPCMLLDDGRPMVYSLYYPFKIGYPSNVPGTAIEVLDDTAVDSLLKIKNAVRLRASLMFDVLMKDLQTFIHVGHFKAIEIGHTLYEGATSWTGSEVLRTLDGVVSLTGKEPAVRSVREIVEDRYVYSLVVDEQHMMDSINFFLSDDSRKSLFEYLASNPGIDPRLAASLSISDHPDYTAFAYYTSMVELMKEHLHPDSICRTMIALSN